MAESADQFSEEVRRGERFAFGENWRAFLATVDDARIAAAERSLCAMLECENLAGKTFVDAGSGSGLCSLAARRLGAHVHSFDYDPTAVECTMELRRRYAPDVAAWTIERGSVLDESYLRLLGQFDVVHSWGVLHHTGDMHTAMNLIAPLVKPDGGKLFIAIYNDQGLKKPNLARREEDVLPAATTAEAAGAHSGGRSAVGAVDDARSSEIAAAAHLARRIRERGMSAWRDVVDWVGGLPFEIAKPEEIFDFYRQRGFELCKLVTVGGRLGNNQFVFRNAQPR